MKIEIEHRCAEAVGFRSAAVKSLFNVETGAKVQLTAALPIEDRPWQTGLIVGPSGSGKTSLGRAIWGPRAMLRHRWPKDIPVIEAVAPEAPLESVTSAFAAVGLGTVPAWLRPYQVLSNGERFRADLARVLCDRPERVVIDEFSSVVDRQAACIGASAFAKAWRRQGGGQVVALSCHRDIVDWLQPDWIYDTERAEFSWRRLRRPPSISIDIFETDWRYWPRFEPHHYLKLPRMIAARCYIGVIHDEPVCHVAFSTRPGMAEARACRLVIMPEWQGAGIGLRFLNEVCALWRRGVNRYRRPLPTLFHTSHPGLAAALRRHPHWMQVSCNIGGGSKVNSAASISRSAERGRMAPSGSGYGGHFRAAQGFRYVEGIEMR